MAIKIAHLVKDITILAFGENGESRNGQYFVAPFEFKLAHCVLNVTMFCPPIHEGLECHLLPETNLFCALTLHFYCMFRVFVLLLASQDVFLFSCTLVLLYNL